MNKKNINVSDVPSEPEVIPVRRRNPKGAGVVIISASIPVELNQVINGISVKTTKSRSLVITELLKKGLK